MSLQFILKTPTHQDFTEIYQDLRSYLLADPENQVFIITDDNMKFDLEMSVLRSLKELNQDKNLLHHQQAGMMRLQVQSFKRLAWYLLQKQDAKRIEGISDLANTMLIGRVLTSMKDDLVVYRGEYNQIGFIEALADLFKELINGQITSEFFLESMVQYEDNGNPLVKNQVKKMKEIASVYKEYEGYIAGQVMGEENVFQQLRQAIQTQDLSKTRILITGFDYFNAQELETIVTLLDNTPQVQIALNLDQEYYHKQPDWYELFTVTGKTYHQLAQFARGHQLAMDKTLFAGESTASSAGFQVLDHYLRTDNRVALDQNEPAENDKKLVQDVMDIWEVPSVYMEADQVSNEIYQLVSSEKNDYRYNDIQVLLRDEASYTHSLEASLKANDIPYFSNYQDAMELHPLYHFMTALYKVYKHNWRYQDIIDLLRSELLMPLDIQNSSLFSQEKPHLESEDPMLAAQHQFRDAVDLTENVVLRNGYEGQFWWNEDRIWSYILVNEDGEKIASDRDIRIEQTANQLKAFVVGALKPLFENWQEEQSTKDAVTYFYQFLTTNHIPDSLMAWRDEYIEAGQLQEGRQHEQAWQTFVGMLDDYVQLFAEESFDTEYFFKILDVAFQNASYSIVPPTMDAVTIGSFDENKVNPKKITFIMGMSKYALPAIYEEKSLLTDEDRQLIAHQLGDLQAFKLSADTKNNNEAYKAYQALLSATDHLYISYPLNNGDKDSEGLSPMLARIASAFDVKTKLIRQPDINLQATTTLKLGGALSQTRYLLAAIAESKHSQQDMAGNWQPVFAQVQSLQASAERFKWLSSSLDYHNIVRPLTPELATSLYGNTLSVSVSQLELYNRDPFSYFLKYGLKLQERPSFELDSLQTGNYFHDMLDHFYKEVSERDFDLGQLSESEITDIIETVSEQLNNPDHYPEYTIFTVNHRNEQLQKSMRETIKLLAENMVKQRKSVAVSTLETEQRFGYEQSEPDESITHFTLSNGQEVRLRGRIDRLDGVEVMDGASKQNYVQIVDYKSSAHKVSFEDIYLGSQLQLYTYLKVALEKLAKEGKQVTPLGAFYQRIFQPIVKIEKQEDLTEANITANIMKDLKLEGHIRLDYDLVEDIHEDGLEGGQASGVYPIKRKKNGDFDSHSKVLTEGELSQLLDFIQDKIVATAEQIISGDIALNPIEDDRFVPSMTEPYRSVSMFDATDYMNQYRQKPKLKPEDFFQIIQTNKNAEIVEEDEDEETD